MKLKNAQQMVEEFNLAAERSCPEEPQLPEGAERALSINLIAEESNELIKALQQRNPEKILDAVCDLIYVTLAVPVFMGINIEPFFNEVHRSNMTKFDGDTLKVDKNNKIVKGPGFSEPALHTVFTKEYRRDLYSI
jgi:predicted HAD superfamily Cof-like phosphohydrolase